MKTIHQRYGKGHLLCNMARIGTHISWLQGRGFSVTARARLNLWTLVWASSPNFSQHGSHGVFSWFLDSGPWCTGLPVTRETLVTLYNQDAELIPSPAGPQASDSLTAWIRPPEIDRRAVAWRVRLAVGLLFLWAGLGQVTGTSGPGVALKGLRKLKGGSGRPATCPALEGRIQGP